MLLMKKTVTEISDDYYPKRQIDVVKHIRDYLVSQLTAGSQLGTLIAKHNISVSQFRKVFRAIYGKPVCRYLTEYRLEQAAIELSTSDKPITEIAYALGFSSPSKLQSILGNATESRQRIIGLLESQRQNRIVLINADRNAAKQML